MTVANSDTLLQDRNWPVTDGIRTLKNDQSLNQEDIR